jgi:hypothetical protein
MRSPGIAGPAGWAIDPGSAPAAHGGSQEYVTKFVAMGLSTPTNPAENGRKANSHGIAKAGRLL